MIRNAAPALVSGALFGGGLAVSGMTKPAKVIGFLDVFGAWDASLMFVMMGAIGVHLIAYRWIRGRRTPLLAARFALPTRRDVDLRLVAGAGLFGVGWGIGGYCPGPALTSLATGATGVVAFAAAMVFGMVAAARMEAKLSRAPTTKPATEPSASQMRKMT